MTKKLVRRTSIVVASAAVSVGLMGFSAPAHAKIDSSWGYKTSASQVKKPSKVTITKGKKIDSSWGYKIDSSWGY